jgi:hypothetical protein
VDANFVIRNVCINIRNSKVETVGSAEIDTLRSKMKLMPSSSSLTIYHKWP